MPSNTKNSLKDVIKSSFPWAVRLRSHLKARAKATETRKKLLSIVALEEQKIGHVRQKETIKVAFIVNFSSAWKLDHLYELMLKDPKLSPCIVIAPIKDRDPDWSQNEIDANLRYHQAKGRDVYVGTLDDAHNRNLIDDIGPDVVFATNPFSLVPQSLHHELIEKYLVCYVPYHMEVGRYGGDQGQYNSFFHNAVWRIFSPHSVSRETFEAVQTRSAENVVVTGYPGIEPLVSPQAPSRDVWEPGPGKRIIWAPHHTIDMPLLPYANFLEYADFFVSLVDEYAGRVRWCFKPHPLLYPKLLVHPDWGEDRTDAYFNFWKEHASSQVETGEYIDLFLGSDAMIHDSGSFLAEYLHVDKPVQYVWSSPEVTNFFNDFGLKALDACVRADNRTDIRNFVDGLIDGKDDLRAARRDFLEEWSSGSGPSPSEKILEYLKQELSR